MAEPEEQVLNNYEVSTKELVPPWQRQRALRTVAIYTAFCVIGIAGAILGPSVVSFQILLEVGTKEIAWGFTAEAVGYLAGAIFCGIIYSYLNKELLFLVSLALGGGTMIMIGYSLNLAMYIVAMTLWGVCSSFIDTGAQSYVLKVWEGHKFMPAVMQGLHSMFSVGSTLGPLMVQPFLADILLDDDSSNKTVSLEVPSKEPSSGETHYSSSLQEDVASVRYGFIIASCLVFFTALLFLVTLCVVGLSCLEKHRKRLKKGQKDGPANAADGPKSSQAKRFTVRLIVLVVLYYFFFSWVEGLPGDFLATFVVKGLGWENNQGALITTVYWGTHGLGRLLGIVLAMCMRSDQMVFLDLFLATAAYVLMFFISYHDVIIWIAVAVAGLGIATLFASALLYMQDYVEITGSYSSVIVSACAVGRMVGPVAAGYLMDVFTYMAFVYLCLAATVVELVTFIGIVVYSRRYGVTRKDDDGSENQTANNDEPVEMNRLNLTDVQKY